MFEININIRWFVTFAGYEALKQHIHSCRIYLGDTQAITDRGIGRRAASLAKDIPATGKLDNVMYCQEIGFIVQV